MSTGLFCRCGHPNVPEHGLGDESCYLCGCPEFRPAEDDLRYRHHREEPPMVHDTDPSTCPGCGVDITSHVNLADTAATPPTSGDCVICFECSQISVYCGLAAAGQLRLREPTDAELLRFLREPEVHQAITRVRVERETRWRQGGTL